MAPIYMLAALKGTDLYERLKTENRLSDASIEIDAMSLNFKPEMNPKTLIEGYRRVITTLYDSTLEHYFKRCLTMFEHLKAVPHLQKPRSKNAIFLDLMGLRRRLSPRQLPAYNKFIARVSKDYPRMLPEAIRLAALGYHFEKVTRQQIAVHEFKESLTNELERFKTAVTHHIHAEEAIRERKQELFMRVQDRYQTIPSVFRYPGDGIEPAMATFKCSVNEQIAQLTHSAGM